MSDSRLLLKETALDAIGETFFILTAEGDVVEWNQRLTEVTGYSDDEIAEMHSIQFVPSREAELVRRQIEKVLEEGQTRVEAHYQTKKGRELPYEFVGSLLEWEGDQLICGTGRPLFDSTDRQGTDDASARPSHDRESSIRRKNMLLQIMNRVASAANEAESFEDALQEAVDAICEQTGWPIGHVYRRSEDSEKLVSSGIWSQGDKDRVERGRKGTEQTAFAPGDGLPGRALERGDPVWMEDVTEDSTVLRSEVAEELGLQGALAFPLTVGDEVVAVLEFFSEEEEPPDDEFLATLTSVGMQLSRVAERERVRRSLEASEEQYRSLKESAADGIVIINSEGEVTDWNQGATEIFGYEKEEILGRPVEVLLPDQHKEAYRRDMERVNRTGEGRYLGTTVELEGLRKSGEEFPLELSLSSWTSHGERYFAAILRDVTERRQWEKRLQKSEQRYRRLFEDSQEGIAITTPEGEILDVNSATQQIFGYSREELLSMNAAELHADPAQREAIAEELAENGRVTAREVRLRRKDGREIICELSGTIQRGDDGEPDRWQGFFRDVTERKEAEEALRESEEMFRTLAEKALVGIALLRGGEYLYVNPALARITGYDREELLKISPQSLFHPADRPHVQRRVEERLEGDRREAHYEARIQTQSGETKHVEIFGSRITYQGESAIIGTILDITDRRQLQREILRVQEEERRRLGQELHDGIASQLTGATLMLSSLTSKVDEEASIERLQEVQEIINGSASDVRRLSRGLNPGGLSDEDLPSALRGLAQNTEEARFVGENLPTDDPEGDDLEIGLDVSRLERDVATHLYRIAQEAVANARRHGEAEEIVIRLRLEDGSYVLEVEDDGVGFDPSGVDEEGLGLRSMRHRAELLRADFSVESSPGEGTLVRCRLPA